MNAEYRNYQHYILEGWANAPKESFKALADLIRNTIVPVQASVLDVGCATGELIHYLSSQFNQFAFTGIDVFPDLIEKAKHFQPDKTFLCQSILDDLSGFKNQFDIITVVGVMSIFDETTIEKFWDNLLMMVKPGGKVFVLSPLNEFGVDTMIRHRKRMNGVLGKWETGWNIFSPESISEILKNKCSKHTFIKFNFKGNLSPKEDPVRTWTIKTDEKDLQLTNGMKLLIDHYFIDVTK